MENDDESMSNMKHGANIYKYAKKVGLKAEEIVDFSSNINFLQKQYDLHVNIKPYYEPTYKKLKNTLSKVYGIPQKQIALFNGASSAIMALLYSLKEKEVTLYAPLFGEYEKASKDKKITLINRYTNLHALPKKGSIVVFVNPATPDGKYYDLKKLFKIWKKQNCIVILDESFLEFEEKQSYRSYISSYPELYIIQSFSKFYGCAGVRIGAIFAKKKHLVKLPQPMWALSSFDVEFLLKRLRDSAFRKETIQQHKKQKKQLKKILERHFEVYESDANFFLVKNSYKKLFKKLLKQGILIRPCGSFDFLDDGYIRFAVKDKKSHKKLKKALRKIV